MNSFLLIAVSLLVPSIIAMLVFRFGADSRPPYRSSEHDLALHGMAWNDDPPLVGSHEPRVRLVSVGMASACPTLAKIDGARGPEAVPFASDPHAARLEDRARELADAYWSDSVWLTGLVPAILFQTVCAALEQERITLNRPLALPIAMTARPPAARAG